MWKCFWLGGDLAVKKKKKNREKRNETNGGKSGLCTRMKEPGQSTLLFIFVTSNLPATIRWKNNKPQNYDECSQKGKAAANIVASCMHAILKFSFI